MYFSVYLLFSKNSAIIIHVSVQLLLYDLNPIPSANSHNCK